MLIPKYLKLGKKKKRNLGRARWLMPVIPTVWEAEVVGSLEARRSRSAWPTWQNVVPIKNTKRSQAWWHVPAALAT